MVALLKKMLANADKYWQCCCQLVSDRDFGRMWKKVDKRMSLIQCFIDSKNIEQILRNERFQVKLVKIIFQIER